VIFWIFFLIPILTGRSVTPTWAALTALIVFNASYMAEVIRGGLQAWKKAGLPLEAIPAEEMAVLPVFGA